MIPGVHHKKNKTSTANLEFETFWCRGDAFANAIDEMMNTTVMTDAPAPAAAAGDSPTSSRSPTPSFARLKRPADLDVESEQTGPHVIGEQARE